jgi:hypothetical protein
MIEEQEEQLEEEVEEAATEEVANEEQPDQGNSLFSALFEAAEEPLEPEEPEEDLGAPITLNDAIDELAREPQTEEEEEGEAEEESEPEGDVEAEAVEPDKAEPKTKAARKKKVKQVVDPDIDLPEPTPNYAFPEEDPDKEFIDGLLPEERDIYDLAKFASDNLDGYVGKDKEFKDYFQKTKKYIEKRIQDDPHVDLSEDEDYQAFIHKNRPDFDQFTIKKVERERNVYEAMRRIEEKQAPEKERARMEQEKARKAPVVQGHKSEFRQYSVNAIPKELSENVKDEEAIKQFAETNPLEFQIVDTLTTELHNTGDLLLDITQGMVPYDQSNPIHTKLLQWVNTEQENFIQSGQTQQDGKTFMRRERYFRLPENKRTAYYTWNDADLLAILTMRARQRIEQSLAQQRQLLEQSGYARQVAKKKQQMPQPKKRAVPPKVASKPRPGNSPSQAPNQVKKSAFESVLGM